MKIYSLIVCYNPDIYNLNKICKSLLDANTFVVLVDNTINTYINDLSNKLGVKLITNNDNFGIAKAQNIGIEFALNDGADVIVFFDQDSLIEKDFIENLTAPLKSDIPMVVSPVFHDRDKGFAYPSYKINKFGLMYVIKSRNEIYDVDMIISSGSATTKVVFDIVGLMDESYYIDYVDTEWCLRCRANKIPIKVVPSAKMIHAIGEKSYNLGFMRVFVHSPIRTYYKVRNSFIFSMNENVPFLMGVKEIFSALLQNFIVIFITKENSSYFKNFYLGIIDGLLGIKGKKK